MRWDPAQYARYASERGRPFSELVARIGARSPGRVVDLGCGSGELTAGLAGRWPAAAVTGIDASAEMIAAAPAGGHVTFAVGTAEDFDASAVDVLVSNAMLQWIPGHLALLTRWAAQLAPGGWLAFQVPANFDAPSHRLMRRLAAAPEWRDRLAGVLRGAESVASPVEYLDALSRPGWRVDAWQTEYQHVLAGPDPVLEWVRGTGLRPVMAALDPEAAEQFVAQYAALLRDAYPQRQYGTVLAFRRTFVVARKP